ncbi:MAG: helix-turn-helix domain-containing protein [Lachnospiraceae bacterium]|nr:helix-turn-helix domain-containing protein [Lachnospiraceae bacterium]
MQEYIRSLFLESYKVQTIYISLLQMILQGKDISSVLSAIADDADSSLVIIDMSGKILASSSPFRLDNNLWQDGIQHGYCPPAFIEHIRETRRKKTAPPPKEPFVHLCEDEALYYLCNKIIVNDDLFGYVFMIQKSPQFSQECRELLPLIGKTIAETTSGNAGRSGISSSLKDSVFLDILDGVSPRHAQSRILSASLVFPPCMRVIAVRPLYFHGDSYLKMTLPSRLNQIFPDCYCVPYQKELILIATLDKHMAIPAERLGNLCTLCARDQLIAGISRYFYDASRLREYYLQATRSCILAQRLDSKGNVFLYEDFTFFDMLEDMPRDKRLSAYCHPALALLREYDQQKQTHLYETLKTYTLSGFNQNETARQLFLHRNTMNYRRQRIEELTGLDLASAQTRFLLQYSFLIDVYMEHAIT